MTQKYRQIINTPIKKINAVRKRVADIETDSKKEEVIKGAVVAGMGLTEFMLRFFKLIALDNKMMRKLEKKLSEIKVGKDKDGNEKKFQAFVKRNPNLSAVIIWWTMLAMLISGANFIPKNKDKDKTTTKKEIQASQSEQDDTIDYDVATRQQQIKQKLGQTVKMTDAKTIKGAILNVLPYIDAALFATENYCTGWFGDGGGNGEKNTLGVGLYYVPATPFDFNSTDWVLASTQYKEYKDANKKLRNMTDDEVYAGIKGWFFKMDYGYNINIAVNVLKNSGVKLKYRDLAVISSVLFNSPDCCKAFCKYIVAHPNDRTAWARYLLQVDNDVNTDRLQKFGGLKSRRVHEILLLLDVDNYCDDMFGIQIDCKRSTAVSFANNYYDTLCVDFSDKNLKKAKEVICRGVVENGVSVCQVVQRSGEYRDSVLAYCSDAERYVRVSEDHTAIYNKALQLYRNQDYKAALQGFEKLVNLGCDSPELFNDLAITYIHNQDYDKSIWMSKKALVIGGKKDNSYSYFNMGLAYEYKQDYKNARLMYEKSAALGNKAAEKKVQQLLGLNKTEQFKKASDKTNNKLQMLKTSKFAKGLIQKR